MSRYSENNKRIAKNALFLYLRMFLMMIVSLYTSRVILNSLGVEDFGIYNVVGGVVAMFSIISGSLSAAISRFITYELGRNNKENLNRIFSTSILIQLALSLIVVVLIELIGVWFLNSKMTIPADRIEASNWVLQFSVITFIIKLISIPYNATIIAHEKMSAFAYISIFEAIGKLFISFLIVISPVDRLVFYSILMCAISIVIQLVYIYYCRTHFQECVFRFQFEKSLLKRMFGFAGWNFIGSSAAILRDQGGNIIINLFFGPTVNAARGIAMQVHSAISGFVTNFMTALNPQITKSYASGDYEYMMTLIFQGARFSFYMLLLLSLPIMLNANYILNMWLTLVPEHSVTFVRLMIGYIMSESLSNPLITVMLATGTIRNYQLVVGGFQMLNLPISYFCLSMGCVPESVMIVAIVISQCCLFARLYMLRGLIGLSIKNYLKRVYSNVLIVAFLSSVIPCFLSMYISDTFLHVMLLVMVAVINTLVVEFYFGCDKKERVFVQDKIIVIRNKFIKNDRDK